MPSTSSVKPRAVLDTNVLVAALMSPKGTPAELVRLWRRGRFVLVSSPRLLVELNRALAKPKIRDRVEASAGRDFIEPLLKDAEVIDDPPHPERVIAADQTDDFLVALAKAGSAGGIVAGDRHLLEIAGLEPPAVTPRAFLTILRRHLA